MFPILKERGVTISLLFGVLLPPIMHLLFKTTSMAAGLVTVAFFIILRTLFVVSINPNANIRFRFESFFLNLLLISFPVIHIIFSGVFLRVNLMSDMTMGVWSPSYCFS